MWAISTARAARALLLSAWLGFAGGVPVSVSASETQDAAYDALSGFIDVYGADSGSGWNAAAVQLGEQRYLVVRRNDVGDIFQLGNFDGVFVERLDWNSDRQLVVDYLLPNGKRFQSVVELGSANEVSPSFSVLETTRRRPFSSVPDMDGAIGPSSDWPLMTPFLDRP